MFVIATVVSSVMCDNTYIYHWLASILNLVSQIYTVHKLIHIQYTHSNLSPLSV